MSFEWVTILCLVLYALLLPFYIYGFRKWYQWKAHLLFRLRYSYPEGLALIIVALCLVHLTILEEILKDLDYHSNTILVIFSAIYLSLVLCIYGIIYYRATLTFLTFKQHQSRLSEMCIGGYSIKTSPFTASSPRKHYISRTLFTVYIIFPITMIILRLMDTHFASFILLNTLMTINMLIAVFIFIMVKKNKVFELIGCLIETYFGFAVSVVMILFIFIIRDPKLQRLNAYIMYHLWSLSTLYFTLYFIYKSEATLRRQTLDEEMVIRHVPSIQTVHSLSYHNEENEVKQNDNKKKTMIDFLRNKKDYEMFSQYLAMCFCVENLMFIQRVCVFRWLIIERIRRNSDETEHKEESNNTKTYYSLKFEFAEQIYKEYNDVMKGVTLSEEKSVFESDRSCLWLICNGIYNEFIKRDCMHEVNIPYHTRTRLDNKMRLRKDMESNFESYQDLLDLYNEAMFHIWSLLLTVYEFRFAMYLERHTK